MTADDYEGVLARIRAAQAGDEQAMEALVVENDALVRFVVRKYLGCGKEYEDLYQLGRLGLVRAIKNFQEEYGARFSTYAVPMIMGEIRRFLRDDGQMRVSRTIRENARRLMKSLEKAQAGENEMARLSDICADTGLTYEEAVLALGSLRPVRSLSEPVDESGDIELGDTVGVDPFETVEKNLLVRDLMDSLDGKERRLLELRYFQRLTQVKVAEMMGLTQVQVSRLEKKLLTRLRKDAV